MEFNDYNTLIENLRREEERNGKYTDPWKYTKEKQEGQKLCSCKNDPSKQKGTCGCCGGWVNININKI